ncbi:MAG: site-specific integrase [Planctomycetaceae bacterium]|jgi:integrase|nr:site-specific integrase [Planctomycetaceae bacterium]
MRKKIPPLCDSKGYAVVYCEGQRISLNAKIGTIESKKAYANFVKDWLEKDLRQNPNRKTPLDTTIVPLILPVENCCLENLFDQFLISAEKENKNKTDLYHCRCIIGIVLSHFRNVVVGNFSNSHYLYIRDQCVDLGYSRRYVNKLMSFLRSIFRFGENANIVPRGCWQGLSAIRPLRYGHTAAPEKPKRTDVSLDTIRKTLPYCTPTIAAMITLQFYTSARPSEIWSLRVKEINQVERAIEKEQHKTRWATGKNKIIPLSEIAYELILPFLKSKKSDDYLFSPSESEKERRAILRQNRKSKVTPSQKKRDIKNLRQNKNKTTDHFRADTYNRAVNNAIKRANRSLSSEEQISKWTPYQIRHSAITCNVMTYGLDVARAIAGQKTIAITQNYNHADVRIARATAEKQVDFFCGLIPTKQEKK